MKHLCRIAACVAISLQLLCAQSIPGETIATTLQSIKAEAVHAPRTLETISQLSDVIGSRVTWSPGFNEAADWTLHKLQETGLSNPHIEEWEPEGKSWEVKRIVLNQATPYFSNLIASPKHFSPGTNGLIKGKAVYLEARTEADLEKYAGKLKGTIVFASIMPSVRQITNPMVSRYTDEEMKTFELAKAPTEEEKAKQKEAADAGNAATLKMLRFMNKRVEFCMNEGAVAMVEHGRMQYGTTQGLSALLPVPLGSIDELFCAASRPDAPKTLPQLLLSVEQYNSMVRTLRSGVEVTVEVQVDVEYHGFFKGKNVVAEIPGTDLKNEVVIVGAHFDTQGPSIGATDNAVGAAVCMEAIRILKQVGAQPRRTIRICLWGGEEQGYLGSKAYVQQLLKNAKNEKCYMYFNTDNGAGRFRGLHMEERPDLLPMMNKWLGKIDMKMITTISKTEHTDHVSFVEHGIPGFQFIQDNLDYFSIYHTNMDRMERIPADDVRDNAIIMASLAYLAATE